MAIQPPYRGQPLRASWATEVTDAVNALAPMAAPGLLARQGLGGTGYAPVPSNRRQPVASSIPPFAVRHVEESEDDETIPYTGWEIYLPSGCVSVGSTCHPINPQAYREIDGENVVQRGWYRIGAPSGSPEDGDRWPVIVHAKCSAALSEVDTFQDWPKKYVWAEIKDGETQTQQERENDPNDVGDTFSSNVGTICWNDPENGVGSCTPTYAHHVRVPIGMTLNVSDNFNLLYAFKVDADDLTIELDRLFVKGTFSAAGTTFYADSLKELETDDEEVWLKVTTLTNPYTAEIKAYTRETHNNQTLTPSAQVAAERNDGEIYIRLYVLKNGHVVSNTTSSAQNIQVYQ